MARKGYRATTTFARNIIFSCKTKNFLKILDIKCQELDNVLIFTSTKHELTFVLEDGVPGVPPGIIGVEGVPIKKKKIKINREKLNIFQCRYVKLFWE